MESSIYLNNLTEDVPFGQTSKLPSFLKIVQSKCPNNWIWNIPFQWLVNFCSTIRRLISYEIVHDHFFSFIYILPTQFSLEWEFLSSSELWRKNY